MANYLNFRSQSFSIMKRIVILFFIFSIGYQGLSQNVDESTRRKASVIFTITNDFYVDMPDSVDARIFNPGANLSGLYDYRFGKSNFSFAFGIGIGSHNLYSDAFAVEDTNNVSALVPISSLHPGTNYKKNKISYTYFDIPLEFRLRTKKDIRASLGFKFGFLIDSHTKYRGDDYLYDSGNNLFVKFKDVPNIESFRYGITGRIGWKFINLTGFYSLTNLFTKNKGPETYPVSIGISLMPF
jgi:hypothetical protein